MSAITARRKRARKACNPCHQRKRKCDGQYPCGMCTAYEYSCSYGSDGASVALGPLPARSGNHGSGTSTTSHSSPQFRSPGVEHAAATGRNKPGNRITNSFAVGVGSSGEQSPSYAGASAARAFPHILSEVLGSSTPPKTHAIAYNFGIRPEEAASKHDLLSSTISERQLSLYSDVYFSSLAPVTDIVDPETYARRCHDYYHGQGGSMVTFGAVAAGVAALGSFLSPERHPRESDLVQYAKAILDDPAFIRGLGVDHIIASGLRMLYLRATSRPENAWIASCTVIHLCEAMGLHQEDAIVQIASTPDAQAAGHDADRLRRIFWISWAGHNILSYEYNRSFIHFSAVTCGPVTPVSGSVAHLFVQMAQVIPAPNSPFQLDRPGLSPREDLCERLQALHALQVAHPFLILTKADLSFCFYRRIYEQPQKGLSAGEMQLILDCGDAAVSAAGVLSSQGRLFWNVIGSVFHYVCVLLAMDAPAASAHLGAALAGLQGLAATADTGVTREAVVTAQQLVNLTVAKKQRELATLEAVQASYQAPSGTQAGVENDVDSMLLEGGWDLDWDNFTIDPYLSMLGDDLHFQ